MRRRQIDYVVLAGFLWLVPENLLTAYPNRIVNIHPALLPRHGGKGMYGDRVHRAVVEAGDRETGITIHRVNERYDSGDILAQYRVPVTETDTPETVAAKVHALEYEHFPAEIEKEISVIRPMPAKGFSNIRSDRSGSSWALSGKCCSSLTPPLRSLTTTTRAKYRHDFRNWASRCAGSSPRRSAKRCR